MVLRIDELSYLDERKPSTTSDGATPLATAPHDPSKGVMHRAM
jgi:hypothetical protein